MVIERWLTKAQSQHEPRFQQTHSALHKDWQQLLLFFWQKCIRLESLVYLVDQGCWLLRRNRWRAHYCFVPLPRGVIEQGQLQQPQFLISRLLRLQSLAIQNRTEHRLRLVLPLAQQVRWVIATEDMLQIDCPLPATLPLNPHRTARFIMAHCRTAVPYPLETLYGFAHLQASRLQLYLAASGAFTVPQLMLQAIGCTLSAVVTLPTYAPAIKELPRYWRSFARRQLKSWPPKAQALWWSFFTLSLTQPLTVKIAAQSDFTLKEAAADPLAPLDLSTMRKGRWHWPMRFTLGGLLLLWLSLLVVYLLVQEQQQSQSQQLVIQLSDAQQQIDALQNRQVRQTQQTIVRPLFALWFDLPSEITLIQIQWRTNQSLFVLRTTDVTVLLSWLKRWNAQATKNAQLTLDHLQEETQGTRGGDKKLWRAIVGTSVRAAPQQDAEAP